jgi:RNA:NAD 2'-phosphotransferase (TPT1/KptA family)
VKADLKQRYDLVLEALESGGEWWIRANQGHSVQVSIVYLLQHVS